MKKTIETPKKTNLHVTNTKSGSVVLQPIVIPNHLLVDTKKNQQVLFDQVLLENANKRQATHSTLTKAEVRGGGKKPRPQKHSGNSRQGSIRNPQWVGGGVCFGPKPTKNYRLKTNAKAAQLAFKLVLTIKNNAKAFYLLGKNPQKTSEIVKILKANKLNNQWVLFVYSKDNLKLFQCARNVYKVIVRMSGNVSINDLLKAKTIIFDQKSWDAFCERSKQ